VAWFEFYNLFSSSHGLKGSLFDLQGNDGFRNIGTINRLMRKGKAGDGA